MIKQLFFVSFLCLLAVAGLQAQSPAAAGAGSRKPLKVFISVDMEGIGGIGTSRMLAHGGKDYETGRKLATAEVNAVVAAIFAQGPAEVLVNDSHGDMQNLYHLDLDPRVEYIQGNNKPLGMVQGLDGSYDGAIFIGYHTRAGTEGGFQAHTGSGVVKGLWINDQEVGEGGLNALFAGSMGVPVILASGDDAFVTQFGAIVPCERVTTKYTVTTETARLIHPTRVLQLLGAATKKAIQGIAGAQPLAVSNPIRVRMKFDSTTRADVAESVPNVKRVDGFTIAFECTDMTQAYKEIRLMYKYLSW
ncbi:MAG: M55 family metallopeptidase [Saprospiraceae bacterium]|nr:M55 family metallopeptidase [Saprospiraceae bacterium]